LKKKKLLVRKRKNKEVEVNSVIRIVENKHYLYRVLNIDGSVYTICAVAEADEATMKWNYFSNESTYEWVNKKVEAFTGYIEKDQYIGGIKVVQDPIQKIMRKLGYD
jgi:hypothetical protein